MHAPVHRAVPTQRIAGRAPSRGTSGRSVAVLLASAFGVQLLASHSPAATNEAPLKNAVHWQHPAGFICPPTYDQIRSKLKTQAWARRVWDGRQTALARWVQVSSVALRNVFPKKRGNVYHNFSCPDDRSRLKFDPLSAREFKCPTCGRTFAPDFNAGIYEPKDRYYGTVYDGWICLFFLEAPQVACDLGVAAELEPDHAEAFRRRGIEILMLHADTIEKLQTRKDPDPQMSVLLTYHREGDSKVLFDLACAYEVLRNYMTPEQRARFERVVLERILNDMMLEPLYRYEHNNLYQWHRTIVQTALALERRDLIDWSFGYGAASPEALPEHRSIRRLLATHFKPDGAFWEMCSGYHLYPLFALCEFAVVSRNLSLMDPEGFPPARYDLTDKRNDAGQVIKRALEWFLAMAMPDRTMPTIGDSMAPRAGLNDYYATAEVGYRFFDLKAVAEYKSFREGSRSWGALLYGAPELVPAPTPFTSSFLSSGWVSLRNEWDSNRVWIGLNALIPGGGHQHADRLGIVTWSQGELLALEKATPYNDHVTRELGTRSESHNTVTVDLRSQRKGDTLKGAEIPRVDLFFNTPVFKFARLTGDKIYPQTSRYRRSVLLFEDVYVDCFEVAGGKTNDWMLHHAGPAPVLSLPTSEAQFEPSSWLANGLARARVCRTDDIWNAQWQVNGVTSRLTMLGAPGSQIYSLETYPIDQAVITTDHPSCQTLCVRRNGDTVFLAIGDAWRTGPNLQEIHPGDGPNSLFIKTRNHRYHLRLGAGSARFEDGVTLETDGAVAVLRDRDAALLAGGRELRAQCAEGTLKLAADQTGCFGAQFANDRVTFETARNIQYETVAERNIGPAGDLPRLAIAGDLWRVRVQHERRTFEATKEMP